MEKEKDLQAELTKLIFSDVFHIKTETTFEVDGTITVTPRNWKPGKPRLQTPTGKPAKIWGKVVVDLDGLATFKPSRRTGTKRYDDIYKDKYLTIKATQNDFIFKLQAEKDCFENKTTVKPVIGTIDWLKKYINSQIIARLEHERLQSKI